MPREPYRHPTDPEVEGPSTGKVLRLPARPAVGGASELARRRLRDPRWQDRLADAVVEGTLARPVRGVLDPELVAGGVRAVLLAAAGSAAFDARFEVAVGDVLSWLGGRSGPIGGVLPLELRDGLRALAARPVAPAPDTVRRLLDHPPVRASIRELVVEVLRGIGPRALGEAGGAGGAVARRARASIRTRALGRLALGVADAVSDEVERSVERRTRDAVDGAMSPVLGRIAAFVGAGRSPREREALQVGLLDATLALPGPILERELRALDPTQGYRVVIRAFERWLADEETSTGTLADLLRALLAREGDRTVGEVLEATGLSAPVAELMRRVLRNEIAELVATRPFSAFLDALFDPDDAD